MQRYRFLALGKPAASYFLIAMRMKSKGTPKSSAADTTIPVIYLSAVSCPQLLAVTEYSGDASCKRGRARSRCILRLHWPPKGGTVATRRMGPVSPGGLAVNPRRRVQRMRSYMAVR